VGVTFALVHGAWHGGWCWERLHVPLEARGHRGVAMDLPCDDVSAGLDAHADVVVAALDGVSDEVIVVAHSLGGLVAPLVAARRPVRSIAYLAAFVPVEGQSMDDQFAASPEPIVTWSGGRPKGDGEGRSVWPEEAVATAAMYPDLAPEDARWAFARLRAQAGTTQGERPPDGLPTVPAVSFVCAEDRVVNPAWSRRVAPERTGAEAIELPAGHFPMITAPERLADALAALA
jgi:pimeloyl-ACP methyl ester carboxylesterase